MSTKKRPRTPTLPTTLRKHNDRVKRTRKSQFSRKDARKQDRLDRKQRRAAHFAIGNHEKRTTEEERVDDPDAKRRRIMPIKDSHQPSKLTPLKPEPTALEKLVSQTNPNAQRYAPRIPRSREEAEEDVYIAYLEAKLGYANGAKRRNGDEADGLGDLLDFANGLEVSLLNVPDRSDTGSDVASLEDLDDRNVSSEGKPFELDNASIGEDDPAKEVENEESHTEDEWTGFCVGDGELSQQDSATEVMQSNEFASQPSDSIGRHFPSGLRKESAGAGGEEAVKLTRQLKGLINRMSEQNMLTVLNDIEEVYRKHRRHDVTSTLTTLIINSISSHAMLLDSFVALHAAFISSLHRLIGVEFAAFVVQNIISVYERHLCDYETDIPDTVPLSDERGKECSNLIVLLSELYNFQVISCILLYDVVKDLLGKTLTELRVELLLKILRNSGQQLRQDDPSALKEIVTLAQSSISSQGDSLSSRTKFMIETLTNLKNNKVKKSATQHQGGDAVERMKKFLSGLGKKRHVQAYEPLRASLQDLRVAETKGKWWLVGAAWGGDPLVDRQHDAPAKQNEIRAEDVNNTMLVKLARKQGMNTDIRRSIFVVLMSSDDYLDACERLAQLNLSEVQQREIVRVLLHCCGNEKTYNPYYTLVCQHLCQRSHAHKITLQFCLWDFLRDLGEKSVGGAEVIKHLRDGAQFELKRISSTRVNNVAKAYGWWIAKDCCSITVLKPVDFTILKSQTRGFLREMFIQIFVASQASSPALTDDVNEHASRNRGAVEDIFVKATKMENLGLGLTFFLSHTFKGEKGLVQWASTLVKQMLQTSMNEIPRL